MDEEELQEEELAQEALASEVLPKRRHLTNKTAESVHANRISKTYVHRTPFEIPREVTGGSNVTRQTIILKPVQNDTFSGFVQAMR